MPTDASAGEEPGSAAEAPEDEFVFAAQDLGRGRPVHVAKQDDHVDFAPVRRTEEVARPAPAPAPDLHSDGFVIHQPQGVAPAAPVDALVVGAPAPAAPAEPDAPAPAHAFRISSSTGTAHGVLSTEPLWTTRDAAPDTAPPPTAKRGWSTRNNKLVDRSAQATMLRLREEAVNISWKSAWIAVTSADRRLSRKGGAR